MGKIALLFIICFINCLVSQPAISWIKSCDLGQFFDIASLDCKDCGKNEKSNGIITKEYAKQNQNIVVTVYGGQ